MGFTLVLKINLNLLLDKIFILNFTFLFYFKEQYL